MEHRSKRIGSAVSSGTSGAGAIAPQALRFIESLIGDLQKSARFHIRAHSQHTNANAHRNPSLERRSPILDSGMMDRRMDALGDRGCPVDVGIGQKQQKFISTVASQ